MIHTRHFLGQSEVWTVFSLETTRDSLDSLFWDEDRETVSSSRRAGGLVWPGPGWTMDPRRSHRSKQAQDIWSWFLNLGRLRFSRAAALWMSYTGLSCTFRRTGSGGSCRSLSTRWQEPGPEPAPDVVEDESVADPSSPSRGHWVLNKNGPLLVPTAAVSVKTLYKIWNLNEIVFLFFVDTFQFVWCKIIH